MVLQHTFSPATNRLNPIYKSPEAAEIHVNLADGTYAKGTALGELTATPGTFKPYATGNADGSETLKGFLRYACVAASGSITLADEVGLAVKSVPMFYAGAFKTTDLTGLDAAGLADLNGRLVAGTIADGVIAIG